MGCNCSHLPMNIRFIFSIVFGISLIYYSCRNGDNQASQASIVGKWNVYASEINNKQSKNMENAFFHFKEDGKVHSNLFEDAPNHQYSLKDNQLIINTPEPIKLEIRKLSTDSLELEGVIKVFYMKFFLTKSQEM